MPSAPNEDSRYAAAVAALGLSRIFLHLRSRPISIRLLPIRVRLRKSLGEAAAGIYDRTAWWIRPGDKPKVC